MKKGRLARRFGMAAAIAMIIQLPFLLLMSSFGIHSSLGGIWALFYLPAILVYDKIGLATTSPFNTVLKTVLIQEIILLAGILLVWQSIIALRR